VPTNSTSRSGVAGVAAITLRLNRLGD